MAPKPSDPFIEAFTGDLDHFAVVQRIHSLRITPQPNAVVFKYTTSKPTVPLIEIFGLEYDRQRNLVFTEHNLVKRVFDFLGPGYVQHAVRIRGLDQKKRYSYRIKAGDGPRPAATAVGTFTTGERRADVYLLSLLIRTDGDPGLKGAGELDFAVAVYSENGAPVASKSYWGEYDPGTYQLADPSVTVFEWAQATDVITVYVSGRETDRDILGPFFETWSAPIELPAAPSHFEVDNEVRADAMETRRLPDEGYQVYDLTLDSGPWGISYALDVRVAVRVTNPPAMMKKSLAAPPLTPAGSLSKMGASLALKPASGKAHLFALGPDGFIGRRLPRPARGDAAWAGLPTDGAEWTTLVMRNDDRVDVIIGREGTLRHAEWVLNDEKLADVAWRVIGRDFQPWLTPVLSHEKITLIGLGPSGEVRAAVLDGQARHPDRWKDLGGRFAGPVAVLSARDTIELFALTKSGGVAYASWNPGADSKVRWIPLGGESIVHLFAGEDGNARRLMGVTQDRLVVTMFHENGRWPARWEIIGALDDLEIVGDSVASPRRKPSAKVSQRSRTSRRRRR